MNDSEFEDAISPIEDIIEDARNGRMYILVDAEDRENEGDLIIPGQFATPDQVNFMARFGRGLICLAMNRDRARALELDMMTHQNRENLGTAFTVSIEAKEGVTTGISAHDRSHTIAVAIDPTKGPDDIVSPGHVFPLVARNGGVLVRAGHTEAAVDISRMAGLYPAGVICEIMNDDGSMARLPELIAFAQLHGLKVGTIADLIAYRRKHDTFIERRIEREVETIHGGVFKAVVFRNSFDGVEHFALVKGDVDPNEPCLVRVHRTSFLQDVIGYSDMRPGSVEAAMNFIKDAPEPGVIVFIRLGQRAEISTNLGGKDDGPQDDMAPLREYGVGAQVIRDLGVRRMILLANNEPNRLPGLEGYGLKVEGWRKFTED